MIILSLCHIRFFLEKPLEVSCTFVTIKRKEFLKEVLLQTDCFLAHLVFSLWPLFLSHELQKYFVFCCKGSGKDCETCWMWLCQFDWQGFRGKCIEWFFLTLFTNFNVQLGTILSFDYLPALILQFSCKLVLMLFNTTLMGWQNWNKKKLRQLLEVVVKSCDH